MTDADIRQRKVDHIELCARQDVEFRGKTTLLEQVQLIHQSLPELSVSALDKSTTLFGKRLRAPLVITGMTGGAERARQINYVLAALAERNGLAFGVGSQRAMLLRPETSPTYQVRHVAPNALLFGNIGVVQARDMSTQRAADLVGGIGADALCVHLNPAQELIQADGDRDFRGCIEAIARLQQDLVTPIIVKETGCGIAPTLIRRLFTEVGVRAFDISGAGGTTWVGVEALRAQPSFRDVGEEYWDWGIPTAAILLSVSATTPDATLIASGGMRSGLDAARAISLGASLIGMALPLLRAVEEGGEAAAQQVIDRWLNSLDVAMTLTASHNLAALRRAPKVIGPDLARWAAALDPPP
jgi:isopentenyl-diphosphate delta-isomerase